MQTTISPRAPPCRPTISLRGVRIRTWCSSVSPRLRLNKRAVTDIVVTTSLQRLADTIDAPLCGQGLNPAFFRIAPICCLQIGKPLDPGFPGKYPNPVTASRARFHPSYAEAELRQERQRRPEDNPGAVCVRLERCFSAFAPCFIPQPGPGPAPPTRLLPRSPELFPEPEPARDRDRRQSASGDSSRCLYRPGSDDQR